MPVRCTIRDVARQAGVSVGTVSKVFNNKSDITDATRQRVLHAAAELNFTPNALIRSLQSRRTHTIGVFIWPVASITLHSISMVLLKGISAGLSATRRDMLLYSHFPERQEPVLPTTFLDGRVDGVIFSPATLTEEGMQALTAANLPGIALYQPDVPEGMGSVGVANADGIFQAVTHLVALGHRRIAYSSPDTTPDYWERREGYQAAMQAHGLPCAPELSIAVPSYHTEVDGHWRQLATLPDSPTALIAGDDAHAMRWRAVIEASGVCIPSEFSLVGFDDAPVASITPTLTTIEQPVEEVGRIAALHIDRLLNGEDPATCRTRLPVRLVVRESTAPVRAKR